MGVVLAMTCANKQLSNEVTHFIYSNNTFRLTLAYHRDWITQIGHKNSGTLQDVILVGGGRPKVAAEQLSAMITTLWKRARGNLRQITVHDTWGSLHSAFIVRHLLEAEKEKPWRSFWKLETIKIDIPHEIAPIADKPLYEKLCSLTKANITGRFNTKQWTAPLEWGPQGWHTTGNVWLEVSFEELQKN
jgi:hypothetical protein